VPFTHIDKQVYTDATLILAASNHYSTNYSIGKAHNTTLESPACTSGDFTARILLLLQG
jgi:hypothetical protein